jgi:hypothetical protein
MSAEAVHQKQECVIWTHITRFMASAANRFGARANQSWPIVVIRQLGTEESIVTVTAATTISAITNTNSTFRYAANWQTHLIRGLLVCAGIQQQPRAVRVTPLGSHHQRRVSVLRAQTAAKHAHESTRTAFKSQIDTQKMSWIWTLIHCDTCKWSQDATETIIKLAQLDSSKLSSQT